MKNFYSFPDIEQFRNVIVNIIHKSRYVGNDENGYPIYDETISLPTLKFNGTIKLHGTNAGIIFQYTDGKYECRAQSRSSIITIENDNAGFAQYVSKLDVDVILNKITIPSDFPDIKVFGEWCGKGIQKKMAINNLDKMFVIFAIKIGDVWLNKKDIADIKDESQRIFNIMNYETYEIDIDFNDPKTAADKMGELVTKVEKECPVGKSFGFNGIGEGIVWTCITTDWEGSRFWFKTKGEEHKGTKTKEKVAVDVERVNSIKSLVETVVAEPRLLQGIDQMRQNNLSIERKNLGFFLKWIFNDVVKEESDTITKNNFTTKDISSAISEYARKWFFNYEDKQIFKS